MCSAYYEDTHVRPQNLNEASFNSNNRSESLRSQEVTRSVQDGFPPGSSLSSAQTRSQPVNAEDVKFLDELIERIMSAPLVVKNTKGRLAALNPFRSQNQGAPVVDVFITENEIRRFRKICVESFKKQPMLLRIEPTKGLYIFGDLHGQLRDVRMCLDHLGMPSGHEISPKYLFLGDYIDRGLQGVETFILLAALKCRYPKTVHLLRGNHEDLNTAMTYGMYDEILSKYKNHGQLVWLHFISIFNWMPLAALIGGKLLAMHGGISPHLTSLHQINGIERPTIIPPYGLMCDLLWADPDVLNNSAAAWAMSPRGISFSFDEQAVISFCYRHNIEMIIRAHQINTEMLLHGHKWFGQSGRLITLFSAPNYLNMGNAGGVLWVEPNSTNPQQLNVRVMAFRPSITNNNNTVRKKKSVKQNKK